MTDLSTIETRKQSNFKKNKDIRLILTIQKRL